MSLETFKYSGHRGGNDLQWGQYDKELVSRSFLFRDVTSEINKYLHTDRKSLFLPTFANPGEKDKELLRVMNKGRFNINPSGIYVVTYRLYFDDAIRTSRGMSVLFGKKFKGIGCAEFVPENNGKWSDLFWNNELQKAWLRRFRPLYFCSLVVEN